MSISKGRGYRWEAAVVEFLRSHGWPHAERRVLSGSKDRGDVAGVAGVCIEAKNTARLDLAGFLAEAVTEQAAAGARVGVAWVKRRGRASAGEGYVVMTGEQFVQLLADAGYRS